MIAKDVIKTFEEYINTKYTEPEIVKGIQNFLYDFSIDENFKKNFYELCIEVTVFITGLYKLEQKALARVYSSLLFNELNKEEKYSKALDIFLKLIYKFDKVFWKHILKTTNLPKDVVKKQKLFNIKMLVIDIILGSLLGASIILLILAISMKGGF